MALSAEQAKNLRDRLAADLQKAFEAKFSGQGPNAEAVANYLIHLALTRNLDEAIKVAKTLKSLLPTLPISYSSAQLSLYGESLIETGTAVFFVGEDPAKPADYAQAQGQIQSIKLALHVIDHLAVNFDLADSALTEYFIKILEVCNANRDAGIKAENCTSDVGIFFKTGAVQVYINGDPIYQASWIAPIAPPITHAPYSGPAPAPAPPPDMLPAPFLSPAAEAVSKPVEVVPATAHTVQSTSPSSDDAGGFDSIFARSQTLNSSSPLVPGSQVAAASHAPKPPTDADLFSSTPATQPPLGHTYDSGLFASSITKAAEDQAKTAQIIGALDEFVSIPSTQQAPALAPKPAAPQQLQAPAPKPTPKADDFFAASSPNLAGPARSGVTAAVLAIANKAEAEEAARAAAAARARVAAATESLATAKAALIAARVKGGTTAEATTRNTITNTEAAAFTKLSKSAAAARAVAEAEAEARCSMETAGAIKAKAIAAAAQADRSQIEKGRTQAEAHRAETTLVAKKSLADEKARAAEPAKERAQKLRAAAGRAERRSQTAAAKAATAKSELSFARLSTGDDTEAQIEDAAINDEDARLLATRAAERLERAEAATKEAEATAQGLLEAARAAADEVTTAEQNVAAAQRTARDAEEEAKTALAQAAAMSTQAEEAEAASTRAAEAVSAAQATADEATAAALREEKLALAGIQAEERRVAAPVVSEIKALEKAEREAKEELEAACEALEKAEKKERETAAALGGERITAACCTGIIFDNHILNYNYNHRGGLLKRAVAIGGAQLADLLIDLGNDKDAADLIIKAFEEKGDEVLHILKGSSTGSEIISLTNLALSHNADLYLYAKDLLAEAWLLLHKVLNGLEDAATKAAQSFVLLCLQDKLETVRPIPLGGPGGSDGGDHHDGGGDDRPSDDRTPGGIMVAGGNSTYYHHDALHGPTSS